MNDQACKRQSGGGRVSEILNETVAARLVRALRLDSVMVDVERSRMRPKVLWPHYNYDRGDRISQAENHLWLEQLETDEARRRSWRTKAAWDDYLEVMGWLVEIDRLTRIELTEDERAAVDAERALGKSYRMIARKLGLHAPAVAAHLGLRRGREERRGLSNAEFVRRVALEWDFQSIARADNSKADSARTRWAAIVQVASDVVNARIGSLYSAPGMLRRERLTAVATWYVRGDKAVEEVG